MAKTFLRRHIITIFAHISAWGVFLILPFLITHQEAILPPPKLKELPIEGMFLFTTFLISVFYINYGLLVPRLLNRYGIRYYLPSLLLFLFLHITLIFVLKSFINQTSSAVSSLALVFPFLLVIAMSLSVRLLVDRTQADKEIKERENETLKSELSFLRSQISPHFLFNIMNNVVALSRVKPEKVEPTLIQLSHLMRYMLYNSDERKVSIEKEIEYLESYIDLQKLRFGDSIEVVFEKNTEGVQASTLNPQSYQIEPMLLIPFVENAFKHGTVMVQNPEIKINLEVSDNQLIFNVLNKFETHNTETKDKDSGIGLKNVSRRLDLLYGENQTLAINTEGGIFKVDLIIALENKV